jgi:hypothetical protein
MYSSANIGAGMKAFPITPHASTNLPIRARSFYVGVGGDVTLVNFDDTTCLLVGVPQGAIIPCECKRINAIGTTASGLVGFL